MINEFKESKKITLKGFLIFILLVSIYILVPQLVGSIVYHSLNLSEQVSLVIGNIVAAIIIVVLLFPTLKKSFKEYFSDNENFHSSLKYWGIGFLVMAITNLILNILVFPGEIAENEELNRQFLLNNKFISFFEITLIAPFVEEIIFRFALRKLWGKNKYFPLFTALIFGGLHALTGIHSISDLPYLLYIIPYGALGYAFGYLYNKNDNIFSSLTVHSLHNFISYMMIILGS